MVNATAVSPTTNHLRWRTTDGPSCPCRSRCYDAGGECASPRIPGLHDCPCRWICRSREPSRVRTRIGLWTLTQGIRTVVEPPLSVDLVNEEPYRPRPRPAARGRHSHDRSVTRMTATVVAPMALGMSGDLPATRDPVPSASKQ